jgi:hypothetical protein
MLENIFSSFGQPVPQVNDSQSFLKLVEECRRKLPIVHAIVAKFSNNEMAGFLFEQDDSTLENLLSGKIGIEPTNNGQKNETLPQTLQIPENIKHVHNMYAGLGLDIAHLVREEHIAHLKAKFPLVRSVFSMFPTVQHKWLIKRSWAQLEEIKKTGKLPGKRILFCILTDFIF